MLVRMTILGPFRKTSLAALLAEAGRSSGT
jgi:hypothetical protein